MEKFQTHLAKHVPSFQSTTASFTCSEKCINAEFPSAELFAKPYPQCHKYTLIYYENRHGHENRIHKIKSNR